MLLSFCKRSALKGKNLVLGNLTHLCQLDSSTFVLGAVHCQFKGCLVSFFLLPCLIENSVFNANNVDPDQTACSVASDLGLHGLPMSLLWDAGLK